MVAGWVGHDRAHRLEPDPQVFSVTRFSSGAIPGFERAARAGMSVGRFRDALFAAHGDGGRRPMEDG